MLVQDIAFRIFIARNASIFANETGKDECEKWGGKIGGFAEGSLLLEYLSRGIISRIKVSRLFTRQLSPRRI